MRRSMVGLLAAVAAAMSALIKSFLWLFHLGGLR